MVLDGAGAAQFTVFIVSVIVLFGMLVAGYLEIEQQYKQSQKDKQTQLLNQKVLSLNLSAEKSKTSSVIANRVRFVNEM
jgi:heme/copper-type cytochrome/quinol oxidase subunit 3